MNIGEILKKAEREVLTAEYGGLRLGVRLRLWRALEERYGREGRLRRAALSMRVVREVAVPVWEGLGLEDKVAEIVPRLSFIARLVTLSFKETDLNRHTSSIFAELGDIGDDATRRGFLGLLGSSTQRFRKEADLCRAIADRTSRIGDMLEARLSRVTPPLSEGRRIQGGCALTAAILACTDVFGSYLDIAESDYDLDDEDVDYDSQDPHHYAARATTDQEESPEGVESMRAFWLRWIRDLFPSVLTTRVDLYTFP